MMESTGITSNPSVSGAPIRRRKSTRYSRKPWGPKDMSRNMEDWFGDFIQSLQSLKSRGGH